MKSRVLTSVAIVACALLLVICSEYIVFPIALALLAVIAVFEILRVIGVHKKLLLAVPAYILAIAFPISAYFVKSEGVITFLLILAAIVYVYLMWLMGVSIFSKGSIPFSTIAEVFASALYVVVSFTSMSLLRYIDKTVGVFCVVLVFVICWVCDVSAFAVGSLMGKHKLIPEVSPKKTVEGAIGGVVFSALLCLVYGLVIQLLFKQVQPNYLYLFIFGLVLSVVSQLGDLVASLIKREYGIKDYGSIFPGHGGIMDRFDSVLAVSTILLILSIVLPPFVAK
ncbi:MAG: phosphatidate cytidylyltransferase [Clostridia bacterium]|nr:phosphatidate cytidylyltransferase [Clostridia bacterium]